MSSSSSDTLASELRTQLQALSWRREGVRVLLYSLFQYQPGTRGLKSAGETGTPPLQRGCRRGAERRVCSRSGRIPRAFPQRAIEANSPLMP
ncbi:hypothetical protein VULLAG_LOCUS6191 [Vulpes lagopus]